MSDTPHELTRSGLNAMAAEAGTEAGPGATTKEFNRALIDAFRANRGVVPGELQGASFLLLTTIGAKSGAKRTTPLVYHRIGGRLLIIASTGGGPRNPGWFDNLAKNPSVTVELGDETWEGKAVELSAPRRCPVRRGGEGDADIGRYQSARSARSRWSSYCLRSSARAIRRRATPVAWPLCLRLQPGGRVRGWGAGRNVRRGFFEVEEVRLGPQAPAWDVDDMPGSVREAGRVLEPGGHLGFCVTHPFMDAGRFASREADAAFVVSGSYLGPRRPFEGTEERAGLEMTFRGWCYPLEAYARAFEDAGFLVETLREPVDPRNGVRQGRRLPVPDGSLRQAPMSRTEVRHVIPMSYAAGVRRGRT